jgi:predicted nucleic-acid-binding Zn-ribbon protein
MEKCPKCGSDQIDRGKLWSAGGTAYKSDKHKIVFKENSPAYVCMNCGFVELYVGSEYLDKIRKLQV